MRPLTALLLLLAVAGCQDRSEPVPPPADPVTETDEDASGTPLSITIDDLPWVGPLPAGWSRLDGIERVIQALDQHDAPATGFVNCGRVSADARVLRRWLDAGYDLGNHTDQHLDLNRAAPSLWVADAVECDEYLRDLTGASSLTFRYPYLHRGHTVERYRAAREALDELGTTIAPVSINTGDWIIDDAYVAALRNGNDERAREIGEAYVDHVARAADHYRSVAVQRVGRDVAHILLLHANALLATHLDAVLTRLREDGFHFITLEAALRDPVYALQDDYVGPEGLSWLYRIPPAEPSRQAWDDEEASRLRALIR